MMSPQDCDKNNIILIVGPTPSLTGPNVAKIRRPIWRKKIQKFKINCQRTESWQGNRDYLYRPNLCPFLATFEFRCRVGNGLTGVKFRLSSLTKFSIIAELTLLELSLDNFLCLSSFSSTPADIPLVDSPPLLSPSVLLASSSRLDFFSPSITSS
ncbi:hypothetical protein BpHYR1_047923 [Brachionus plicatilis]|uniref:Uncharacterized protein n=1 Tax=Brachionus plicatilis TaxID=10195 RepID=A0A3M7RLB2_BRAPC|nr:hypothetical protein BpHYR1_047923 [Brachionus plicatilis]